MHEEWDHIYRLRRDYLHLAIAFVLVGFFNWVGFVLAVYFIDDTFAGLEFAIAFMSVGSGMVILCGVYLVLAYFKYRVLRNADTICVVGVLQTKRTSLNAIQALRWRSFPQGGSCVLISLGTKMTIAFDCFTSAETTDLVAYLHERVSSDLQTNWEPFHDRFLVHSPDWARQQ